MHLVTFDLETRKLAQDLDGGWPALIRGEGGISCLVAWSSLSGRPHLFDEDMIPEAVDLLESADVLLSFNGVRFDIPVLEGVIDRRINVPIHLDLLQIIWDALGPMKERGYSLEESSQRTLGMGKSVDSLLAPELADQGRWAELLDKCLDDVHLTRKLFIFAQQHGGIIDIHGGILQLDFPDWFSKASI